MCYFFEGGNDNIITLTHFEEGGVLPETCNDAEISDEYDDDSIMPPLMSEEEMDTMDYVNESDHDLISTDMLENIHDGSQSHFNVNRREFCYKISDCIRQRQSELKGALRYTLKRGKGLYKVFKTVVKEISQDLPTFG